MVVEGAVPRGVGWGGAWEMVASGNSALRERMRSAATIPKRVGLRREPSGSPRRIVVYRISADVRVEDPDQDFGECCPYLVPHMAADATGVQVVIQAVAVY